MKYAVHSGIDVPDLVPNFTSDEYNNEVREYYEPTLLKYRDNMPEWFRGFFGDFHSQSMVGFLNWCSKIFPSLSTDF